MGHLIQRGWRSVFLAVDSFCVSKLVRENYSKKEVIKGFFVPNHTIEMAKSIHSHTYTNESEIVGTFCGLLRREGNLDSLRGGLDSIKLTDSLVEKVLLDLKEPIDAKRALSFFHWSARCNNYEHTVRSYCITVQILVRSQLLTHARALLESVIMKNAEGFLVVESLLSTYRSTVSTPHLFDFLIQTYAKLRMFELAFDVCLYLEEKGFSSSLITFNTLIHVVQKSSHNVLVWKIYEHMIMRRTYPNATTVRIMISAMCKEGTVQRFVDVLDRIHGKRCSPMVIVNTSLVFRIFEEGRVEEGIVLLKRMLQKNMIFDDVAYSLMVYAHCKSGKFQLGNELYEDMLRKGSNPNSFLYTLFIGILCKNGNIDEANQLMQEMLLAGLKPYDETYNFLIEGCSKVGRLGESLIFFEEMLRIGLLPSCLACNEMVRKLCEVGDVRKADCILSGLLVKGFIPNEETYSYLIDGYGKEGNSQEVLKLYYEMEYRACSPGLMTYTSLIRSLCQCGKLKEAEKYLTVMEDRSLAPTTYVYNTLIAGQCEKGNIERALNLYDVMIKKELRPNSHTFAVLVKRISNARAIQITDKVLDNLKARHDWPHFEEEYQAAQIF
ncbi:pentatricopeptide repeat (PPR) superfamily protein [Tasmannia lanceolata]|uniref:pentatricopeptide repeat (PPR) superfamily protein n=1 Tax=Tasmannia lanceolata TaxID=3420 RepID=UPI0040634D6A